MTEYWPHGPKHCFDEAGAYIVTAGTFGKKHILNTPEKRTRFCTLLFRLANKYNWDLQAWAIMSNHYHFIATTEAEAQTLKNLVHQLHITSAIGLNKLDGQTGRKVWHQYWDTRINYEKSYYARLHYVNTNPVHHGICDNAEMYEWCSASWLKHNASPAMYNTIMNFKSDQININDDF